MATDNHPPRRQWADQPIPLIITPQFKSGQTDIYTVGASQMALIHNAIIRGFNSIYIQARHIVADDRDDFIGYCQIWYRLVKSHIADEETTLYKKLEDALGDNTAFQGPRREHAAFEPGLEELHSYLSNLPSAGDMSSTQVVRILDSFRSPFEHHLHSEVATIAALASHPNRPPEASPQFKMAKKTFESWAKNTVSKAGVWDVVPLFLLNHDKTSENGKWADWPSMPLAVKWGATNVTSNWHAGLWLFSSCDYNGLPQELHALRA